VGSHLVDHVEHVHGVARQRDQVRLGSAHDVQVVQGSDAVDDGIDRCQGAFGDVQVALVAQVVQRRPGRGERAAGLGALERRVDDRVARPGRLRVELVTP
jgi:hypothetical protein